MTWLELSKLKVGDRVVFTTSHDTVFPELVVPKDTTATIVEQGLNELGAALFVRPDDATFGKALERWEGLIILTPPFNYEINKLGWNDPAPVTLLEVSEACSAGSAEEAAEIRGLAKGN